MVDISVVINTFNEERRLPYALRSVKSWVDELIVVDMYSDDKTVQIAEEFGAKVFFHERLGYADPARDFAIEKASGNWILMLDADEIIPAPLSIRLCQIANNDEADIVNIHYLSYLLGRPLQYTGWGPFQVKHSRFFKAGYVLTSADIHNFINIQAKARILEIPYSPELCIVHFNYIDSTHFIEKLNRYTTIEAQHAFRNRKKSSLIRALLSSVREFNRRYILKKGYLDGWQGLYLSLFSSFYRLATHAKIKELEVFGGKETIEATYFEEAERILSMYKNNC